MKYVKCLKISNKKLLSLQHTSFLIVFDLKILYSGNLFIMIVLLFSGGIKQVFKFYVICYQGMQYNIIELLCRFKYKLFAPNFNHKSTEVLIQSRNFRNIFYKFLSFPPLSINYEKILFIFLILKFFKFLLQIIYKLFPSTKYHKEIS